MRFISVYSALAIGIIVLLIWSENQKGPEVNRFTRACQFVAERIYLEDDIVNPWRDVCFHSAAQNSDKALPEQRYYFRKILEMLNVSHLDLFEPQEVRGIWTETKKTTGLISEFMDGQVIVTGTLPNSEAKRNLINSGDQLLSINQEAPSPQLAQEISGEYVLDRKGSQYAVRLEAKELVVDESLKISKLSEKTAQLKVPSFRADYFSMEKLKKISQELAPYKKIILDLRKNQGGNFVSGLRLLSVFLCGRQTVGYLIRPKFTDLPKSDIPDDIDDESQLEHMNKSYFINLQTFNNYPCLTQSLAVLVDQETSSTAELVAQALKDYRAAKILGLSTSGRLLVGVWYPMESLGYGVKISIPEAVYQTRRGRQIEKHGVNLDEVLDYRRVDFENGEDSWLKSSLNKF